MSILSFLAIGIIIACLAYGLRKNVQFSQLIIIANFLVFILAIFSQENKLLYDLGFRAIYIDEPAKLYTLFTSMFIHFDIGHILMNMIVFLLIGTTFESLIGKKKFIFIYFVTGICATLVFSIFHLNDAILLGGASGAIFGILGAFAASYPRTQVFIPLFLFIRMPVIFAALLFAGLETVYVLSGITQGVAHEAHLGGLVTGIILAAILIRRKSSPTRNAINFKNLESLVTTQRGKKILERAKEADVPEVRDAWLSYLAKDLTCPKCGKKLQFDKDIVCECGYKTHHRKG